MRVHVRMRAAALGGAPSGTPEVYLGDPDGVMVQLQDERYCAGSGPLGLECSAPTAPPKPGLLASVAYSHCTVSSSDASRTNQFYQQLFDVGIRAYQGPNVPVLAIGRGVEFLANSSRNA